MPITVDMRTVQQKLDFGLWYVSFLKHYPAQPQQVSAKQVLPTSNEILVLSPNDVSVNAEAITTVRKLVEKKQKICQAESHNSVAKPRVPPPPC